jgi:hypothetical protein
MNPPTAKPGRPLIANRRAAVINIRCTMERKNAYVHAARRSNLKLSAWICDCCDQRALLESTRAPEG